MCKNNLRRLEPITTHDVLFSINIQVMTCDMTEYCYSIIGIKLTEEVNKQIDNIIIYAKNMKYWLPISKEIFWELLKFLSHINENDVLFHPRLWNISTDMLIDMIIYYGIFICENAVLKYLQIEVTYTFEYIRIRLFTIA